jgi:hypothetical protein
MSDPTVVEGGDPQTTSTASSSASDAQVLETTSYDLLRERLAAVADRLQASSSALNQQRADAFASKPMTLAEQDRVRTEAACIPRDAVCVGNLLLVGHNIPPGLATNRSIADVFSIYRLEQKAPTDWDVNPVPIEDPSWFLNDPTFGREFAEIYKYYADARLLALSIVGDELRMTFGIGTSLSDARTLRWRLHDDGPTYLDANGDGSTDEVRYDFIWTPIGREALRSGRWPHLSILDSLFLGGTKGRIEFKIDDAVSKLADGGRLVLSEPIAEIEADLAEHQVAAARVGELILIRLLPYREQAERFYIYSRMTRLMHRVDAMARGCRSLPEGQGVVFPGGYHLDSGETRVFSTENGAYELQSSYRSPNGEDVLYVYRRPDTGNELLCAYNLVRREMAVPVMTNGHALFEDGTVVGMRAAADPQRVHTVAIYTSPFCIPERYEPPVSSGTFLGRIGNAELVHALGESLALAHESGRNGAAGSQDINPVVFETIVARCQRLLNAYAWLAEPEAKDITSSIAELRKSAGDVLDELGTVAAARREAVAHLAEADRTVTDLLASAELEIRDADSYIDLLTETKTVLGQLAALYEVRQIDTAAVQGLVDKTEATYARLGTRALDFIDAPGSLDGPTNTLRQAETKGLAASTAAAVGQHIEEAEETAGRVGLLIEVVGGLQVTDPTRRTAVLARLSELLAKRNSVRAALDTRAKSLRSGEAEAGFAASLGVIGQRLQAALLGADTADACDARLTELLAEVENAELSFGDVAAFAAALDGKRTEIVDALTRRRDQITAERGARIDRLVASAERTLSTLVQRSSTLADRSAVDAFYATDPLATRVRTTVTELRSLGEQARAAELEVAIATSRDSARRAVNDRSDLFEEGTVKIGRHRIGVNSESFEIRLVVDEEQAALKLSGTDLAIELPSGGDNDVIRAHADLAMRTYASETATIPRALGLALIALDTRTVSDAQLTSPDALLGPVRALAASRPGEGFEQGVHDEDAVRFLVAMAPVLRATGGLRHAGVVRAAAMIFRHRLGVRERADLDASVALLRALGDTSGHSFGTVASTWAPSILETLSMLRSPEGNHASLTAEVLRALIDMGDEQSVGTAGYGLAETIRNWAPTAGVALRDLPIGTLTALVTDRAPTESADVVAEAVAALTVASVRNSGVDTTVAVTGLRSTGPGIVDGGSRLPVGRRFTEWRQHSSTGSARFDAFDTARKRVISSWRGELGVESLRPRVLSGFVRNRLVDDVLLPLIGDSLAKQLGLAGPAQGLLLLISPPGYGKTTLVEYVAHLLGFALVKINGPALGSEVTSLDPAAAPDAASAAELVKLNRGFAMGTNTMCYLDDVQHLHPEFLQRFIPLCDGTRRIEGVFEGSSRTYSMSGKRFVMVMAGNPYTSAGASFRIPDMLANRADVHNLGDIVGGPGSGAAAAFAQSYIENSCGVNETLRPVMSGGRSDLEVLLAAAQSGGAVQTDRLRSQVGQGEMTSIVKVLGHLITARDRLLAVNAAYIASAQTDDAMRGEPPFLLQGSYRNMARIAQRIVPAMTKDEVEGLIADHYRTESQTLAAAGAWNLAKWRQVVGVATEEDQKEIDALRDRWRESNTQDDPAAAVVSALRLIEHALRDGHRS